MNRITLLMALTLLLASACSPIPSADTAGSKSGSTYAPAVTAGGF